MAKISVSKTVRLGFESLLSCHLFRKEDKNMKHDVIYYQARIDVLSSRTGRENGRIIAKLKRKIRQLQEKGE